MTRVLFVCHGNICRSVMAELIMKYLARLHRCEADFEIDSAAGSREEIGNPIYPAAAMQLSRCGIPLDSHKARQMTKADYAHFDYIIAMDKGNLREIERIAGEDTQNKVSLLMSYTDSNREIADPWYTGNFDAAYRDIRFGCEALLAKLMARK